MICSQKQRRRGTQVVVITTVSSIISHKRGSPNEQLYLPLAHRILLKETLSGQAWWCSMPYQNSQLLRVTGNFEWGNVQLDFQ